MENVLTPEAVMKLGREFGYAYLNTLPVEERLAGVGVQERLAGIGVRERFAGIDPKEIVSFLKPQEVVTILSREEDLAVLNKQSVLESMDIDELEAYSHEIKRPKAEFVDNQPVGNEEI